MTGFQAGNVNVTGSLTGLQVGNVNVAGSGRGFMLGNVNVCSHLDGEALGNVSIIGNGYRALTLGADETGTLQLGAKLGSRHIYNAFGVGLAALADPGPRWFFAYGLGGHIPLDDRLFLDLDAVGYSISRPSSLRRARGEYLIRLRPQLGANLPPGGRAICPLLRLGGLGGSIRRIALVAGPAFSLRLTEGKAPDRLTSIPIGFNEGWLRRDRTWYQAWVGLMAGLQLNGSPSGV